MALIEVIAVHERQIVEEWGFYGSKLPRSVALRFLEIVRIGIDAVIAATV